MENLADVLNLIILGSVIPFAMVTCTSLLVIVKVSHLGDKDISEHFPIR